MAAYDESKIHSLIAQWEMEQASGRRITPEELCKDTPELLEEFRKKLGQLHQFPASDETSPFDDRPTERDGIFSTPGTLPTIPNYRIEGILGRGGMGVVYKAVQLPLNRTVALKMILSGEHASSDERLRFLAEAEAIAKLQHPGIVQVYEFGTHDNNPYFALEYINGGSLDKKLYGNPLPPREAAELVEKLARAVQSAHDSGIIHRDLKPANILLAEDHNTSSGSQEKLKSQQSAIKAWQTKITDFGLVKNVGNDMTATGQIMGTPSYMAPEQADGKKSVGPCADIYALGAILYECLTGRAPFKAATPLDTLLQVLNDEPVALRQLQAKTPMDLETICHKCLQKEPGKRYGSAAALAEDLGRYLRHEPIIARRIGRVERSWRWCKRYPIVAGLVAVLFISTVTLVLLSLWAFSEKQRADGQTKVAEEKTEEVLKEKGATLQEKLRADAKASEAIEQKHRADDQTKIAINERNSAERLLALQATTEGLRLMKEGNRFQGMLWLTQPLMRITEQKELTETVRARVGNYRYMELNFVNLGSVLHHQGKLYHTAFSPNGRWVVTVSEDKTAQVWDAANGQPVAPPLKHDSYVVHATFSPDSHRIVTASLDKTARVWDVGTGQQITPPLKHEDCVLHASYSPDGRLIVTASQDNTARVWDALSGQQVAPPLRHRSRVVHAAFSPDGERVTTASEDFTAQIWNATTGQPVTPPLSHSDGVVQVAFSPDGLRVATATGLFGLSNCARIWDAKTGQPVTPWLIHQDKVNTITFSADGRRVVTTSWDMTARIWDASNGRMLTRPLSHQGIVHDAIFSPDGRSILTSSGDGTSRIWNAGNGVPITPPLTHQDRVVRAAFSPDGRRFITASHDKTARIWDIGQQFTRRFIHQDKVNNVAFSTNGHLVVTSSDDNTAVVWDTFGGQKVTTLNHKSSVNYATFSQDDRCIVTASSDKTARVWNATSGEPITPPLVHQAKVIHAAFSPNGLRVVTASDERTARVWDAASGQPVTPPLVHDFAICHAAFSPDGRRVITSSWDKTARVWDAASSQLVANPLKHLDQVWHAEFSSDNRLVVTASHDGTAQIWDSVSGQPMLHPLVHQSYVYYAAFSPNNRYIVTASGDFTARVWDTTNGQPVTPPLIHQHIVTHAAFSPDSRRVITSSWDKTARIWDVATGQLISPPLEHLGTVRSATFSPDGQRVISGSWDKTARLWYLSHDERPASELMKISQVYASRKIDATAALQPLNIEKELLPWFQELKAKYPADFSVTPQQARAWRENEIGQCLKEGNLPAALFHQNWLLAEAVIESAKTKTTAK